MSIDFYSRNVFVVIGRERFPALLKRVDRNVDIINNENQFRLTVLLAIKGEETRYMKGGMDKYDEIVLDMTTQEPYSEKFVECLSGMDDG